MTPASKLVACAAFAGMFAMRTPITSASDPENYANYNLSVLGTAPVAVTPPGSTGLEATTDYSRAAVDAEAHFDSADYGLTTNAQAQGQIFGAAHAGIGDLGVGLTGGVTATQSTLLSNADVRAYGRTQAHWEDLMTLSTPDKPAGKLVYIDSLLVIEGSVSANLAGGEGTNQHPLPDGQIIGRDAATDFRVNIAGTGVPAGPYDGSYVHDTDYLDGTSIRLGPPNHGVIELQIPAFNGDQQMLAYTLELLGTARAASDEQTGDPGGTVTAFFNADFQGTLKWGGITGVVDGDTGQPITNWSIASTSGFDYTQAFVPEPSCAAAVAALVFVLSTVTDGRFSRRR